MAKDEAPGGGLSVGSQGNMQFLPNGCNKFSNWSVESAVTELTSDDGEVLFHAFLEAADQRERSYRGLKYEWEGRPREKIAVVAVREAGDGQEKVEVYVSWNGDMVPKMWKFIVETGGGVEELELAERKSFERKLDVTGDNMALFQGRDTRVFVAVMDDKVCMPFTFDAWV